MKPVGKGDYWKMCEDRRDRNLGQTVMGTEGRNWRIFGWIFFFSSCFNPSFSEGRRYPKTPPQPTDLEIGTSCSARERGGDLAREAGNLEREIPTKHSKLGTPWASLLYSEPDILDQRQ